MRRHNSQKSEPVFDQNSWFKEETGANKVNVFITKWIEKTVLPGITPLNHLWFIFMSESPYGKIIPVSDMCLPFFLNNLASLCRSCLHSAQKDGIANGKFCHSRFAAKKPRGYSKNPANV